MYATVFDTTWGLQSMTSVQQEGLFQILDDRIQKRSIIATAQMPVEHWHKTHAQPHAGRRHPGSTRATRVPHQAQRRINAKTHPANTRTNACKKCVNSFNSTPENMHPTQRIHVTAGW